MSPTFAPRHCSKKDNKVGPPKRNETKRNLNEIITVAPGRPLTPTPKDNAKCKRRRFSTTFNLPARRRGIFPLRSVCWHGTIPRRRRTFSPPIMWGFLSPSSPPPYFLRSDLSRKTTRSRLLAVCCFKPCTFNRMHYVPGREKLVLFKERNERKGIRHLRCPQQVLHEIVTCVHGDRPGPRSPALDLRLLVCSVGRTTNLRENSVQEAHRRRSSHR